MTDSVLLIRPPPALFVHFGNEADKRLFVDEVFLARLNAGQLPGAAELAYAVFGQPLDYVRRLPDCEQFYWCVACVVHK